MNQEIRLLLIEHARKGTPASYKEVMQRAHLNHENIGDRKKNSTLLYEISKYEHDHGRPLLSAVAMYADLKGHGNGFYDLAEEFGFGPQKKLAEEFFAITQMNACFEFWKNDTNYQLFAALQSPPKAHKIPFFQQQDVEFLNVWGGQVYDKSNRQHVSAKNYIMDALGSKTVYWSNELIKQLPGFDTFNWRMWSQKGWEDTPTGKVRVAKFKTYTWARIYKKGDAYKDIFFTVGADGARNELVYKLDYYYEPSSELTAAQKEIINNNIPHELRWKSVPTADFNEWDWNKLLAISKAFISEHAHVYDRLILLAWGKSSPELVFNNMLRKKNPPAAGVSVLPVLNPSFKGVETDYVQQTIEHKEIGDAGEELVKQYEKDRLNAANLPLLADKVESVLDGKGYDLISFNIDGSPIYIEVKTTVGGELMPFNYTINEYLFAENYPNNYCIYRLYNFDDDTNTADFYIINEPFEQLLFQPIVYKAYYKG